VGMGVGANLHVCPCFSVWSRVGVFEGGCGCGCWWRMSPWFECVGMGVGANLQGVPCFFVWLVWVCVDADAKQLHVLVI